MNRLVIILLLSFFANLGSAQDVFYIKVDPSCMDRYEYHINSEHSKGVQYISYRLRQGETNHLFLEVGSEAIGYQLSIPTLTDCRSLSFSNSFVDKINKGETQLFIVRKDDIGYNISPVTLATTQNFSGRIMKLHSIDADFQADVENASPDVNLTHLDANNEIYIGGKGSMKCYKEYYFHKVPKETCKPAVGLVLVPELGMVKEITGKSPLSEYESTLNLMRINDVSVETYLENVCAKSQDRITMGDHYRVEDETNMENNSILVSSVDDVIYAPVTTYDNSSSSVSGSIPVSYEQSSTIKINDERSFTDILEGNAVKKETTTSSEKKNKEVKSTKTEPATTSIAEAKSEKTIVPAIKCKDVSAKDFHIVQQGETMYGIARRYGIRVEQIQAWNQLGISTSISPCSKLSVMPPVVPNALETKDLLVVKGGSAAITSSELKKEDKKTLEISNWKSDKSKTYTVQKGDTYYGIATRYGFTMDRFLEMNDLQEDSPLKIGQALKVSDCNCTADSKVAKKEQKPVSYGVESKKIINSSATTVNTLTVKGGEIEKKENVQSVAKIITPNYKRQTVHIVQEDETVQSIAKKYNLSPDLLAQINLLEKNEILIPKQTLFVD